MRFRLKFRVKSSSGVKHTSEVEVDSERGFEVSTETLCVPDLPRHPDASFFICVVGQVLMVESRPEDPGVPLNDKFVKQFPIHVGDRVQLDEYTIELLEIEKLFQTESEVRFLEVGSPRSETEGDSSHRESSETTQTSQEKNETSDSLFSLINIPSPPAEEEVSEVKSYSETTNTKSEAQTIPSVSVKPLSNPAETAQSLPKSEEAFPILPTKPIDPPKENLAKPVLPIDSGELFKASVKSTSDEFKYEVDPWQDQLKESVISGVVAIIASLILSPRIGAFFSSTQTAPGIVGVIFIAIFVLGLCVGFAYLIDHISDTLDLVRSFPEYFRFFVLVLVLMLLPAFALNSFPKVAAILFVAVAFKSFQQFRDTFRPDELKLRAIFIAFFGTLFLFFYVISFAVTRRPAPPPVLLSSAITPQVPTQVQPTQPSQPVREPADETDSAKRKLKEIDTDLDNADLLVPREVSRPVPPPLRIPQQTHHRNPATDLFAVAQLFSAAKSGNLPVVREMIEKRRVSPNQHTESSVTPLMVAAYGGQTEVVRYLISRGAKINGQNQAGTTPLIFAVYGNHKDTVNVLIKSGANYRLRTHKGDTALDIAKRIKNNDIVQLLGGKWVGAKSSRKTAAIVPKNRSSFPRQRKAAPKRVPTGKGVKLVKPVKKKKSKKVSTSP